MGLIGWTPEMVIKIRISRCGHLQVWYLFNSVVYCIDFRVWTRIRPDRTRAEHVALRAAIGALIASEVIQETSLIEPASGYGPGTSIRTRTRTTPQPNHHSMWFLSNRASIANPSESELVLVFNLVLFKRSILVETEASQYVKGP